MSSVHEEINKAFGVNSPDIRSYSPLVLAYLGDAIYEAVVRSLIVDRGNISPNHMNNIARSYVKAETQSAMAVHLEEGDFLDEVEADVYRRGRNAKSQTTAKNASIADYRRATGFEALLGYLYLNGQDDRMLALIKESMEWFDAEKRSKK